MARVSAPPATDMMKSRASTDRARQPQGDRGDELDVAAAHRAHREGDREQAEDEGGDAELDRDVGPERAGRSTTRRGWRARRWRRLSQLGMVRAFRSHQHAASSIAASGNQQNPGDRTASCAEALDVPPFQTVTGAMEKAAQLSARRTRPAPASGPGPRRTAGRCAGWTGRRSRRGEGARQPALRRTGAAISSRNISKRYAHWHERGWNVTAFDWRGQGGSRGAGAVGHDELRAADRRSRRLARRLARGDAGTACRRSAIRWAGICCCACWSSGRPDARRARCWSRR